MKPAEPTAEELSASAARMQGNGQGVAVWPDGRAKLWDVLKPWPEGAAVWVPSEMLAFCSLDEAERRLMRGLKMGGVR